MKRLFGARRIAGAAMLAAGVASTALVAALGTGKSFTTLVDGYEQELYGVVQLLAEGPEPTALPIILGGVAFAPATGDVWATECRFGDSATANTLHRFVKAVSATSPTDSGTLTLHQHQTVTNSPAGCGIVNHPTPGPSGAAVMYSNTSRGIVRLDANTGAVLPWAAGPGGDVAGQPGNGLGIAVDPSNNHLVYVGKDCHPTLSLGSTTCTILDFDPNGPPDPVTDLPVTKVFAQVWTPEKLDDDGFPMTAGPDGVFGNADDAISLIDGIYFNPAGTYLFAADRSRKLVCTAPAMPGEPFECEDEERVLNRLTVFRREPLRDVDTAVPNHGQMVRRVTMTDEPDGVAFATEGFVVTLNEKGGTMTRFDFPLNDYTQAPVVSTFASGGFRGDLLQVGPDGCIYATQGRHDFAINDGTRYDNDVSTMEDSIVRICKTGGGGFEPPHGVGDEPPTTAQLTVIKHVVTDNGGTSAASAWTMNVSATNPSQTSFGGSESGTTITVQPGAFSVTESGGDAGYAQTSAVGCTGTIAAGDSKTCIITNDDIAPTLNVIKHVVNNNGGSALASAWTMNVTATNPSWASFPGSEIGTTITINAGSFSVSESGGVAGYTQTSAVGCIGTIALGESKTCTFVNDDIPPPAAFVTFTQGGWGAPPNGNNPGMLLQNNFNTVFPTCPSASTAPTASAANCVTIGLVGGSGKFLRFTSAGAIRNFLPAGGKPKALTASANNPTTSAAGVLAGQVLALKLSASFSSAGITTPGLPGLEIVSGNPLAGCTVTKALAAADKALGGGGLPAGVSFSQLNDIITHLNENYDNGTTDNGYLVTDSPAVCPVP